MSSGPSASRSRSRNELEFRYVATQRIHILSSPHSVMFRPSHSWDAFNVKAAEFVHEIIRCYEGEIEPIVYGPEPVTAEVPAAFGAQIRVTQPNKEWESSYGKVNYRTRQVNFDYKSPWKPIEARTAAALYANVRKGDIICSFFPSIWNRLLNQFSIGGSQERMGIICVDAFLGTLKAELAPFTVFESHNCRSWNHARLSGSGKSEYDIDRPGDTVIHGFINCHHSNYQLLPDDQYALDLPDEYILQLTRKNVDKGVKEAIEATRDAGVNYVLAGQGDLRVLGYRKVPDHVTVFDYVEPNNRRELLSRCSALAQTTRYFEPLGRVVLEAGAMGKPVIVTRHGAFPEIVNSDTGTFIESHKDFVDAIDIVRNNSFDSEKIQRHVAENYHVAGAAKRFIGHVRRL